MLLVYEIDERRTQGAVVDRPGELRLNFRRLRLTVFPEDPQRLHLVLIERNHRMCDGITHGGEVVTPKCVIASHISPPQLLRSRCARQPAAGSNPSTPSVERCRTAERAATNRLSIVYTCPVRLPPVDENSSAPIAGRTQISPESRRATIPPPPWAHFFNRCTSARKTTPPFEQ